MEELSGSVTVFRYNAKIGGLKAIQNISSLPAWFYTARQVLPISIFLLMAVSSMHQTEVNLILLPFMQCILQMENFR